MLEVYDLDVGFRQGSRDLTLVICALLVGYVLILIKADSVA